MDKVYVGNKIASLRKEKGYTQKQLAEILHVTDKAVSKWERGLNFPVLLIMEDLAAALGISVTELLGIDADNSENIVKEVVQVSVDEKNTLKKLVRRRAIYIIIWAFPVMFEQSIRVTIEHGHNNHRSGDWSSTAYWYQTEPHKEFPRLLEVEKRLPVYEEVL